MSNTYRFEFQEEVELVDAEMSLHLAMYAVEGLYGAARVRLDVGYHVEEAGRVITVDGSSEVGEAIVRVFANLLLREFGEEAFHVRRVVPCPAPRTEGRAA
ncbi:MAG: hypothetical protein R3E01_14905 [Pirellulaceae bacterium]